MTRRLAFALAAVLATPALARAHCDTLDGPVVITARTALETGKLAPVLAWVRAQDEAELRAAFQKAQAARKAGPAAREVADTWFFETVVRVHRAGEGAPFTGLHPAGRDLGPAIPAADQALRTGDLAPVEKLLAGELHEGLQHRFARVRSQKAPGEDVAAGRAWVAAYVPFVHYVEGVHAAATAAGAEHGEGGEGEVAETGGHHHP
ncbi:DUF6448 family protein [Anaeromyxobacter diazotrophicus]|uniref:Uncharacterized protein n=1 Tax=Anaeromyxobacter diazotrophicus TaxID=2590199 RepID=A0A7I9VQW5_9BACT|nr:DUF6448 family protein [Anaeromyxobacter diazotrophicus]GEJ58479.1 hypothetical protein AMYX_32200 [Anaeromyxobacter diazotrophicus]